MNIAPPAKPAAKTPQSLIVFSDFSHRKSGRARTAEGKSPLGEDLYCLSLGEAGSLSTIGIKTASISNGINLLDRETWEKISASGKARRLVRDGVYVPFCVVNSKGKTAIEKLIPRNQVVSEDALALLGLVDEKTAEQWEKEVTASELKTIIARKIKDAAYYDPSAPADYEEEEAQS